MKTDKGIFMIDREVYDFLESFSQCYENELINKQIAKELLEINGLIKLNKEDALCIQKKQKK